MTEEKFLAKTEEVYKFHTKRAPGIPIALQMVMTAREKLGEVGSLCCIAETRACLPDTVQFITGCTVGNGNLKINEQIGRYALTLYDRKDGRGVRIFVDQDKINPEKTPEIARFFLRKRAPEVNTDKKARAESATIIINEFLSIDRDIFTCQFVKVVDTKKLPIYPVTVCSDCKESFTVIETNQKKCLVCSGAMAYYKLD